MRKLCIIMSVFLSVIIISQGCSKTNNPAAAATPNVAQTVLAVDTQVVQQQTAAVAGWTATKTPTVTATFTSLNTPNATQTAAAIGTIVAQQQTAAMAGWTSTPTFTLTPSPNATQTAAAIGTLVAQQQTTVASIFTFTTTPTITPTSTTTNTPNSTETYNITLTSIAGTAIVNGWTNTFTPTVPPTITPTLPPQAVYITRHNYSPQQSGITVDGNGKAYLPQINAGYISVMSTNSGNWGTQLGTMGSGISGSVYGISVDTTHGVIYLANTGFHQIQSYDMSGNSITQWGSYGDGNSMFIPAQFNSPEGVSVDGTHSTVYVADTGNNRIQVFSPDGITCTAIWGSGSEATKPASFNSPQNIFADVQNSKVYVSDTGNNQIQVFDLNGNYITAFGSYGSGTGNFISPESLWVDDVKGKIYVVDQGNYRVEVFDLNYNYITQWGSYGVGDGLFRLPWGVAVDSNGWIYVTDVYNNVQAFTINY